MYLCVYKSIQFSILSPIEFCRAIKFGKVFLPPKTHESICVLFISLTFHFIALYSIHENHPKWWRGFIFHKNIFLHQEYFQTWLLPVNLYPFVTFYETCSYCVVIYFEYLCVLWFKWGKFLVVNFNRLLWCKISCKIY